MPQTPRGHFRRIDVSRFWYGTVTDYRRKSAAVGDTIPNSADVDPLTGATPLDVDAIAQPENSTVPVGRGAWPADPNASSETARSGGTPIATTYGTGYSRVDDLAIPGAVKTSSFDWNDTDVDSVAFGATDSPAHQYVGAGDEVCDVTNTDALGRVAVQQFDITVTP